MPRSSRDKALARPQRRRDRRTAELFRGHGQEPDREGRRTPARPAQPCRRGKDASVNDLKDLLELALSDGYAPDPGQRCDPASDLTRGRRMATSFPFSRQLLLAVLFLSTGEFLATFASGL